MGERTKEALRVHFDARVRLEMQSATLTSDAGLLACRELDDALGLTQAAPRHLEEHWGIYGLIWEIPVETFPTATDRKDRP
jgi:hypothetical protein